MKYEEIEKRQCFRSSGTKEDVPGIVTCQFSDKERKTYPCAHQ